MPVRMAVTAGTAADCTQAEALIDGIDAEYLLADRGYDTDKALAAARERGMAPVIPPKRSRKFPQEYDAALYQARHQEVAAVRPGVGANDGVAEFLRRRSGASPGITTIRWIGRP